ncbi:Asp-tRNA(Asn)/Glu-tRNA(Gln) amidotransferase subunit GatC [Acidicapsa dinghuensis]|uniref:Aspartyl/glutamyl-tRNA(Asn/Gln) amidotransferase subunit C n=1 Tax=Acidicapsa dinghuensis TaxID=2218256 RepID=A0ABW1EA35_9BACT|nr:Asp-tRNA(Asn)/Glu-tRNA(Gln) amidotransferase subunit GatC [Acidicapsa dinghuensis]
MSVSLEEVERVAELASLELAEDEKPRMQRDLNAILEYVAQLNSLDTSAVEPLAQVSELLDAGSTADKGDGAALRVDETRPCLDRKVVMEEAPETNGAFFKVPKVIER